MYSRDGGGVASGGADTATATPHVAESRVFRLDRLGSSWERWRINVHSNRTKLKAKVNGRTTEVAVARPA